MGRESRMTGSGHSGDIWKNGFVEDILRMKIFFKFNVEHFPPFLIKVMTNKNTIVTSWIKFVMLRSRIMYIT